MKECRNVAPSRLVLGVLKFGFMHGKACSFATYANCSMYRHEMSFFLRKKNLQIAYKANDEIKNASAGK